MEQAVKNLYTKKKLLNKISRLRGFAEHADRVKREIAD